MSKIKNWTKVREDAWRNDESGVVVEVADYRIYGLNQEFYGFGFFDPRVNKFRAFPDVKSSKDKKDVRKQAVAWLKSHPYIEKRW